MNLCLLQVSCIADRFFATREAHCYQDEILFHGESPRLHGCYFHDETGSGGILVKEKKLSSSSFPCTALLYFTFLFLLIPFPSSHPSFFFLLLPSSPLSFSILSLNLGVGIERGGGEGNKEEKQKHDGEEEKEEKRAIEKKWKYIWNFHQISFHESIKVLDLISNLLPIRLPQPG